MARQSWISALTFLTSTEGINLTGFRLKSLIGDIESNGMPRLTAAAKSSRALVIDIASDRHGVWDFRKRFLPVQPCHDEAPEDFEGIS